MALRKGLHADVPVRTAVGTLVLVVPLTAQLPLVSIVGLFQIAQWTTRDHLVLLESAALGSRVEPDHKVVKPDAGGLANVRHVGSLSLLLQRVGQGAFVAPRELAANLLLHRSLRDIGVFDYKVDGRANVKVLIQVVEILYQIRVGRQGNALVKTHGQLRSQREAYGKEAEERKTDDIACSAVQNGRYVVALDKRRQEALLLYHVRRLDADAGRAVDAAVLLSVGVQHQARHKAGDLEDKIHKDSNGGHDGKAADGGHRHKRAQTKGNGLTERAEQDAGAHFAQGLCSTLLNRFVFSQLYTSGVFMAQDKDVVDTHSKHQEGDHFGNDERNLLACE